MTGEFSPYFPQFDVLTEVSPVLPGEPPVSQEDREVVTVGRARQGDRPRGIAWQRLGLREVEVLFLYFVPPGAKRRAVQDFTYIPLGSLLTHTRPLLIGGK